MIRVGEAGESDVSSVVEMPYKELPGLAPDPHGLDGNENDGVGCET
jgi:hypothetical protein